jgi:hypothetical protein
MTATHHAPHKPQGGGTHRAVPVDPERDIDAKSTTIWVVVSAVVLFIALYFMLPLFDAVLRTELERKIENLPAQELGDVREAESSFLRGEESRSKKTIEQVMQEMVRK